MELNTLITLSNHKVDIQMHFYYVNLLQNQKICCDNHQVFMKRSKTLNFLIPSNFAMSPVFFEENYLHDDHEKKQTCRHKVDCEKLSLLLCYDVSSDTFRI